MTITYVCPKTRKPLRETGSGLERDDGIIYPFILSHGQRVPDFLSPSEVGVAGRRSLGEYNQSGSTEYYRNWLDWMFATFNEREEDFRAAQATRMRLRSGSKVLITGCGLGDDVPLVLDAIGPQGELYAIDLATEMVAHTARHARDGYQAGFAVCDAAALPFPDDCFDAVFHFGGINQFENMKAAIDEMDRVAKPGGRVVFGDEGVGPWLKETEYGRVAISNNYLRIV